jgi:hypothetical protein
MWKPAMSFALGRQQNAPAALVAAFGPIERLSKPAASQTKRPRQASLHIGSVRRLVLWLLAHFVR